MRTMATCKITQEECINEIENFNHPSSNSYWHYEYLDRDVVRMKNPIQRFRCKDRKNNINFYFLEFDNLHATVPNNKVVFAFKSNSDRTLFLLTYFGK